MTTKNDAAVPDSGSLIWCGQSSPSMIVMQMIIQNANMGLGKAGIYRLAHIMEGVG